MSRACYTNYYFERSNRILKAAKAGVENNYKREHYYNNLKQNMDKLPPINSWQKFTNPQMTSLFLVAKNTDERKKNIIINALIIKMKA